MADGTQRQNEFGQPIGNTVSNWKGAQPATPTTLVGNKCRLEPLNKAKHMADLYAAFSRDETGKMWTYMPVGPFSKISFDTWMDWACDSNDPMFFAIIDRASMKPAGFASFMRIQPQAGVIEVGYIAYSPLLQKTQVTTEASYLMMRHVFENLGYRRYEWKCDNLNSSSMSAAKRLGFGYDGLFRQAMVNKGRNRDTAWFSVLDKDWPRLKTQFEKWLAADNFDDEGRQKVSLSNLISE